MTTQHKTWMCYRCGYVMDAATSMRDEKAVPKEGDISACLSCGAPFIMHANAWVEMTKAEREQLSPALRRELLLHQLAVLKWRASGGKPAAEDGGTA